MSLSYVVWTRGFQLLKQLEFNFRINCATEESSLDSATVQYSIGCHHFGIVYSLGGCNSISKYTISDGISRLIHIRKHHLYVASCKDLTLRVFTEHFELLQVIEFAASVLSFAFNDETSTLYLGGLGYIQVWKVKHSLLDPLTFVMDINCPINDHQRVIALDYDQSTLKLLATCQDMVFVISMLTHNNVDIFPKDQKASLTCALFYAPMQYLITAARDGSIKVWSYLLHRKLHAYTGHVKSVTGLRLHPFAPCVLSCSLDGTVRCWHLDAMNECFRFQIGEGLLGMYCSRPPFGNRVMCYSNKKIYILGISQPDTYLTTLNSDVVIMHVVCCRDIARIVALAEDGGVRLLVPTTGEIITNALPSFTFESVQDIAHDLCNEIMYILLKNGDILVHTTRTNPCTTIQHWVSSLPEESVSSFTLCHIEGPIHEALLFGGLRSGYIVLLQGSKLSMVQQQPAHFGTIVAMRHSAGTSILVPDLVSLGADNVLRVWKIIIDGIQQYISLKCTASIAMHCCAPLTHFEVVDTTLCMVHEDKKIAMFDVELLKGSPDIKEYSDLPILSHQAEDDHSGVITALTTSPSLKLFATSSSDGEVKIWNTLNVLVSEVEFGLPLKSLTFKSTSGDLLLSFQRNLHILPSASYLPLHLVGKNSVNYRSEDSGQPFDSDAKFWYDPNTVPSLPIDQELRKQVLFEMDIQPVIKSSSESKPDENERNNTLMPKDHPQKGSTRKALDCTTMIPQIAKYHLETSQLALGLKITTIQTRALPEQPSSKLLLATKSNFSMEVPIFIESQDKKHQEKLLDEPALQKHVSSLPTPPPLKYPIAPDGFIPNSVIRALLKQEVCTKTKIISGQADLLIPASIGHKQVNVWKKDTRQGFIAERFKPTLKDMSFQNYDTITGSDVIPETVFQADQQDDNRPLLIEENEKNEHHVSEQGVQFVFSESWMLADECARSALKDKNIVKFHNLDTNLEATWHDTRPIFDERNHDTSFVRNPSQIRQKSLQLLPEGTTAAATVNAAAISLQEKSIHLLESCAELKPSSLSTNWLSVKHPSNILQSGSELFQTLLFQLATASDLVSVQNACEALCKLSRNMVFTHEQESKTVQQLLSQLAQGSEDEAMIVAELECLQNLRISIPLNLTVEAMLPLLLDHRDKVRETAFETLKKVANIKKRSHLQNFLYKFGILRNCLSDEDEILQQFAEQLKRKRVEQVPNIFKVHFLSKSTDFFSGEECLKLCKSEFVQDRQLQEIQSISMNQATSQAGCAQISLHNSSTYLANKGAKKIPLKGRNNFTPSVNLMVTDSGDSCRSNRWMNDPKCFVQCHTSVIKNKLLHPLTPENSPTIVKSNEIQQNESISEVLTKKQNKGFNLPSRHLESIIQNKSVTQPVLLNRMNKYPIIANTELAIDHSLPRHCPINHRLTCAIVSHFATKKVSQKQRPTVVSTTKKAGGFVSNSQEVMDGVNRSSSTSGLQDLECLHATKSFRSTITDKVNKAKFSPDAKKYITEMPVIAIPFKPSLDGQSYVKQSTESLNRFQYAASTRNEDLVTTTVKNKSKRQHSEPSYKPFKKPVLNLYPHNTAQSKNVNKSMEALDVVQSLPASMPFSTKEELWMKQAPHDHHYRLPPILYSAVHPTSDNLAVNLDHDQKPCLQDNLKPQIFLSSAVPSQVTILHQNIKGYHETYDWKATMPIFKQNSFT